MADSVAAFYSKNQKIYKNQTLPHTSEIFSKLIIIHPDKITEAVVVSLLSTLHIILLLGYFEEFREITLFILSGIFEGIYAEVS